jgi:hypothetical protein
MKIVVECKFLAGSLTGISLRVRTRRAFSGDVWTAIGCHMAVLKIFLLRLNNGHP